VSHIRAAAIVTVLSVLGTGVSVAQERITICQTQEGQYSAAVAFGADSFLVVWQDGRPGGGVRSIYYTWVDREGGVLPVNGYPLCQGTDPDCRPSPSTRMRTALRHARGS
jgi:hypothetical protein